MATDRILPLEGVHNFRDYGGYAVSGGGRVKRGLLWRSGHHADALDADLAAVDGLALAHVFDMRGNSERERNCCRRSTAFSAQVHYFDGETASLAPHLEAADGALDVESAHRAMERIYRELPQRKPVLWILRRYFSQLANGDGASLVHCHAGKDRTGMAVALLHHALGVHWDDAMDDFLATNRAHNNEARIASGYASVRDKFRAADEATVRVLMGVDERYLAAMRKAVEAQYGSLDAFLQDVLGVDEEKRAALRLHLVEA